MLLSAPVPSIRQHLSYDDCLEYKREDYQNCSVLYCVTQLWTSISTPFLQVNCFRIRFCVCVFYWDQLYMLGLCIFSLLLFGCQYQCNRLPGKTRLQNDLLCVEWDVKLYTLTGIVTISSRAADDCILLCLCVCLSVINHCKQDIRRCNVWIVAEFIAETSCVLCWK